MAPEPEPSRPKKPSPAPSKPVRAWFWARLPDKNVDGTVWEKLSDDSVRIDRALIENAFSKGGQHVHSHLWA
jgi:hypothetical protein